MNLYRYLPCIVVSMLGFVPFAQAHAVTFSASGDFAADNSVYTHAFSTSTAQDFTFSTTSFASGGFVPVLTLFNATTGAEVDNFGSGLGDATLTDTLASGSYVLDLTEFPNVAIGTLAQGFLFATDPTATGDFCGVSGGEFLDDVNCSQLTSKYTLNITSVAATPEPSPWLLVLSGAALVFFTSRRRRIA